MVTGKSEVGNLTSKSTVREKSSPGIWNKANAYAIVGILFFTLIAWVFNNTLNRIETQLQTLDNEISMLRKDTREEIQGLEKVVYENNVQLGVLNERTANIIKDIEVIKQKLD